MDDKCNNCKLAKEIALTLQGDNYMTFHFQIRDADQANLLNAHVIELTNKWDGNRYCLTLSEYPDNK